MSSIANIIDHLVKTHMCMLPGLIYSLALSAALQLIFVTSLC